MSDVIIITLKPFDVSETSLDSIHSNEKYNEPFLIKTNYGSLVAVELSWQQGWGCGYSFTHGHYHVHPDDVTHIEVR